MEIKLFALAIIILLCIIIFQLRSFFKLEKKKDTRANIKLNIVYLCGSKSMTYEEIFSEYKRLYSQSNPLAVKDAIEMSKIIYEMLIEGRLILLEGMVYQAIVSKKKIESDLT